MQLFISKNPVNANLYRYVLLSIIIASLLILTSCVSNSNSLANQQNNENSVTLDANEDGVETDTLALETDTTALETDNSIIETAIKLTADDGIGLDAYYDAIESGVPIFLYFYTYT